jgi:hypothetical protein
MRAIGDTFQDTLNNISRCITSPMGRRWSGNSIIPRQGKRNLQAAVVFVESTLDKGKISSELFKMFSARNLPWSLELASLVVFCPALLHLRNRLVSYA